MQAFLRTRSIVSLMAVVLSASAALAETESADDFTRRVTDELRAVNPAAAERFVEANAARDAEDWAAAEEGYRAVLELQPEFDHAERRLCGVLLTQGRRSEALEFCQFAIRRNPSRENRGMTIMALLDESDGPVSDGETGRAFAHARGLLQEPELDTWELVAVCRAAIAYQSVDALQTACSRLDRQAPDEAVTHYFGWVLAMADEDHAEAERRIARAREVGAGPAMIDHMATTTAEAEPKLPGLIRLGAIVGAVWLGLLIVLFLAGMLLSQAALRAASRLPPTDSGESVGLDAALRRAYQAVLGLSCVYYYLSIPIVLLIVLIVAGGIVWGFLQVGRIPVKLLLIVVVLAGITVWAALKSLFVRARDEDPGELLDDSYHPQLRRVLDEVAGQIGTRPVDNVYMTPGTDLAVMERGSILQKWRGRPERCLILGAGVLDGMTLGPFKAILAHEYGHFSNRDTAGGGFAIAVRRSLVTMAQTLAEGGAAAWYNPAWIFLNGFYRVFLRVSQGASRLQEVLADRWAAFAYGPDQFETGLRHVIDRSVRFNAHADATVREVLMSKGPLDNLYSYRPQESADETEIATAVAQAIDAEPSPYDSHPAPRDRFTWVHALQATPTGDLSDSTREVWSLFSDRSEIERYMTDIVRANVGIRQGVAIPRPQPSEGTAQS